jgi:type II secretory pathway component GspD/PulD (secretin)
MIEFYEDSNSLQIHYYLNDKSHSMNAYTLNNAENELLKIIGEVSKILDIHVITEAHALEEGGIKEIYKFVLKHKKQAKYIGVFLAGISSTIIADVVGESIKTDSEMESLKKQELRLSIAKLKRDLEESDPENRQTNTIIIENLSILLG